MIRIALFCAAGMSTSMLVNKMKEAAKAKGIEAEIAAYPESSLHRILDEGIDIALLGPQVRFKLASTKALCEPKGVPVEVINTQDYGLMNGSKVLDTVLSILSK
jgi:PTS system cellobiose-specific IIB component